MRHIPHVKAHRGHRGKHHDGVTHRFGEDGEDFVKAAGVTAVESKRDSEVHGSGQDQRINEHQHKDLYRNEMLEDSHHYAAPIRAVANRMISLVI